MIVFLLIWIQAVGYQDKDVIHMLISYGVNVKGNVTLDGEKLTDIPLLQFLTGNSNDIELIELLIENSDEVHMLSLVSLIVNKG